MLKNQYWDVCASLKKQPNNLADGYRNKLALYKLNIAQIEKEFLRNFTIFLIEDIKKVVKNFFGVKTKELFVSKVCQWFFFVLPK